MDSLVNVFNRRSIRKYTDQKISKDDLHAILRAGMAGPSCSNTRDWSFIVVEDKETLIKMADANGIYAAPLKGAALGILILGDLERSVEVAKDYWIIDGSIAGQNMILAANALGIGSVWLGTYPQMDRVERQRELFCLPEDKIPHSIIAFGYPAEEGVLKPDYEEDRVHFEKW